MADSTLSITVRDPEHPCAPYQRTAHSFFVQIWHCDGTPLFWRGINYGVFPGVPLDTPGLGGGRIHGQIKVPRGCYLVRTLAPCKNVVGDWAWVDVGCDETVCVDLVIPTFLHCVLRTITGAWFGTVDPPEGEERVRDVMGKEVEAAVDALRRIAEKLPEEGNMPAPPTIEEFERELKQFEEAAGKPQA